MSRQRKAFSTIVEEMGVRVRLYERAPGGLLQREVRWAGRKNRVSLGHRDRHLAEQQVRLFARTLALRAHAGQLGPLTLGVLCQLYREHRAPLLSPARQRTARIHEKFLRRHFGDDFQVEDLSQTHIDGFVQARQKGQLTGRHPASKAKPVRLGTIRQNLNWFAAALRWARGHRVNGRPLLATHPLDGLRLPQEKNVRRPVASADRYTKTLAKADQVDPTGRLACMLALARYTGRRVNAICQLRRSDVLLQREEVVAALAAAGQEETLAQHMPHGAIRWRAEHDKIGYEDVSPISAAARAALEAYLRRHPCLGEAPLFPGRKWPDQPMAKMDALYLLGRAEEKAGLVKLERGVWHPYRRLWAVERKHLPDVDVARAGGWRDLTTMKRSYQRADPVTTLRVVENEPAGHTLDTPRTEAAPAQ